LSVNPALFGAVLSGALFLTLIVSAYTDMARGKIYNWCTYSAMFAGVSACYIAGGRRGLTLPLIGLAVGVGIFIVPYLFKLVGAGDVKLMGAVGALAGGRSLPVKGQELEGLSFVLLAVFLTTVIGAILGLSILIWKGKLRRAFGNIGGAMFTPWRLKAGDSVDETRVPYGVAIALGTFWAWFASMGIL
jgi:prepilin peptidase CpaA